jgi:serine/threonine protein kinase
MAPCLRCGRAKPANAPFDLCAACLLTAALAEPDVEEPRYQTVSLIAEDSGAAVYLAHTAAPGYVALKRFARCDDAHGVMARFGRWHTALVSLRNPHVAPLFDAGVTTQGAVYVVSRYVGGSPLASAAARTHLSAADRAALGGQLTEAVAAIHRAGLVHLKLDASKLKVSRSGGVHLTVLGVGSALVVDGMEGGAECDRAAVARIASEFGLRAV